MFVRCVGQWSEFKSLGGNFTQIGMFTSWFGLDLCSTWNRPEGIGWQKISPVANRRSRRVGWIRPLMGGRRVGRHHRLEKTARTLQENGEKDLNPAKIYEISLDSVKISLDLCEISLESRFFRRDLENNSRNLEIFHRNLGFSPISSGFGGGKPKLTC